jgi:hypothetical protein
MNIYQFHTNPESLDHYEERLTKVPKLAYEHAESLDRRFPEGEPAIAKNKMWAYFYARDVIKGRFPDGEAAIAKDAWFAYKYAKLVIKGRWQDGEAAIAKDAWLAYRYAKYVIEGRFPPGEKAIATSDRKPEYEWRFNVKL